MTTAKILVVDDDLNLPILMKALLERAGYQVMLASGGEEALARAAAVEPDLAIVDLRMPGMDGLTLLAHLLRLHPELPVLMLTAHGTVPQAVEAMQKGADDFLTKPFDSADLLTRIAKALEVQRLKREVARLQTLVQDRDHFAHIVTRNAKMQQVLRQVEQIASTDTTVCLYGESGTGKELIAKALHMASRRASAPFVAINCGAIPEGLLENELFGHVRGAFTGADRAKLGLLQQAHSGTLFLDEVGELPALLQVKLLRVLQCPGRRAGVEPRGASTAISTRRSPQCCLYRRGALNGLWLGSGQGADRAVGWDHMVYQHTGARGVFFVSPAGIPRIGAGPPTKCA